MKHRLKKLAAKRPRLRLPRVHLRRKKLEATMEQALQSIPRITNETVAEHREELLRGARKYIYPLKHSAHRVVIISSTLAAAAILLIFSYCLLALYKFNATSTFIYRVTQVVPFPVAKAGPHFISYENYLFELRHYVHYYQTQQKVDFKSTAGKQQLAAFRQRALQMVVDGAYVKELAAQHHISVSDQEVDDAIRLVRTQNRLGSNDQVFADVLKEFWGWSLSDFKRELRQQILAQKVVSTLDTATQQRAKNVYDQLQKGGDFAALAKQYSDDARTAPNGGDYGLVIDKADRDLPPQVIDALFSMKPGQISGIINTGGALEILQLKSIDGDKVSAAHISFTFQPIATYTGPLQAKEKPSYFIRP